MRSFLITLSACFALSACGHSPEASVACEADLTTGPAFAVGDLQTRVGNRIISDLGTWPNEGIDNWNLASEEPTNTEDEIGSDGTLYISPVQSVLDTSTATDHYKHDYRLSSDPFRVDPGGFFNLTDDALYFRFLPILNDSDDHPFRGWYSSFGLFDDGFEDGANVDIDMFVELRGAAGINNSDIADFRVVSQEGGVHESYPYTEEDFVWFRIRHDASAGEVYWETAPSGCSTWTTRMTYAPSGTDRLTWLMFYASWESESDESRPAETGYIGPLNQQATEIVGNLTTGILPLPKVRGLVAVVGDLVTEIETP